MIAEHAKVHEMVIRTETYFHTYEKIAQQMAQDTYNTIDSAASLSRSTEICYKNIDEYQNFNKTIELVSQKRTGGCHRA